MNYHSYWLAESRDALYAASGAVLARVPPGAASTNVGQGLDIQVARPLPCLLPWLTARENVLLAAAQRPGTTGAQQRQAAESRPSALDAVLKKNHGTGTAMHY